MWIRVEWLDGTVFSYKCDVYDVGGSCAYLRCYVDKGEVSKVLEIKHIIPVRNVKSFSVVKEPDR